MVRSLLLSLAAEGGYVPLWSARVLEEWRRAVARQHGDSAARDAEAAAARMRAAFPGCEVPADPHLEAGINLPDPADAHVLAGAITGKADILLTFNLRDFPTRIVQPHGIQVRHPDGFLWEHFSADETRMSNLTARILAEFDIPSGRARAALKRARLPRFGKAWEAGHA